MKRSRAVNPPPSLPFFLTKWATAGPLGSASGQHDRKHLNQASPRLQGGDGMLMLGPQRVSSPTNIKHSY